MEGGGREFVRVSINLITFGVVGRYQLHDLFPFLLSCPPPGSSAGVIRAQDCRFWFCDFDDYVPSTQHTHVGGITGPASLANQEGDILRSSLYIQYFLPRLAITLYGTYHTLKLHILSLIHI